MTLPPHRALTVAAYLLVADGLAALWAGGILSHTATALVAAAVVLSLWQERLRAPLARVRGGETVPGLIALGISALDLVYVAGTVLDALVHLLLLVLLYRLFTRRTLRDVRDIGFLCFLMLVASAPGTFGLGFLVVLIGYLLAASWALLLRHVLAESAELAPPALATAPGQPGAALAPPAIPARRLFALGAASAAGTLLITATLFFVIPRIGQATLPLRMKLTRMVSGFSEHVSLGSFGEIETDSGVAMRVHIPEGPVQPAELPGIRWRGIVLDHFDGETWTRDDSERWTVRLPPRGRIDVARPRRAGILLTQEVYLEPLGTETLFAAPRALSVAVRAPALTIDRGGTLSSSAAGTGRVNYTVDSELERLPPPRVAGRRERLTPDERQRYLQLPPLAERVSDLARRVGGDAPDAWTAANRLTAYLATRYRYTLTLERRTSLPPVEEFLFVTRSGNCEYFAASLAVMLRTLGIPARVVNGFQRGEWNPFGRYFIVRLRDAHAWVEAHIEESGWMTLDASPRSGPPAEAGAVGLYLDALRMRWYRYVVNWSLHDQVAAAGKVRQAATMWSPSLAWVTHPDDLRPVVAAGAVILLVVGGIIVVRHRGARGPAPPRARPHVPGFYSRALRLLRRRGFHPGSGETAREFAVRVAAAWPEGAPLLDRITRGYERVRFGGVPLSPEERAAVDASVTRLTRS